MLKKKLAVLVIIGCLFPLYCAETVQADGFDFSVQAQIPENQYHTEKTHFDLMMEPGQEQTIQLKLENKKAEPITICADINTAITNINGVVEYSRGTVDRDPTLLYSMDEIVTYEKEVTIDANGDGFLNIQIKMPGEAYEGVLAGGITLTQKGDENAREEEEEQSVSILNEFAYVIGLVLYTTEIMPETQLELNAVHAGSVNSKNVINANLQNTVASFARDLKVTADISRKGQADILYHGETEGMKMAPNSNFDYPVYLDGKRMEAGNYVMKLKAETGGEVWEWEREFTITQKEADEYNELDLFIEEDGFPLFLIIAIVVLTAIIAVVVTVIICRKNFRRKNT